MAEFNWGSLIGDLAGAGVSAWNAYQEREAAEEERRRKQRAIEQQLSRANTDYGRMQELLGQYETDRIRLADDDMITALKKEMANYAPGQTYDFGKFSDEYNKTVEDFLNPEAEKIANLAGLETQAQLAGSGAAKGTGGLAGIGYSRWNAARDLYRDAQEALRADRSQAYTEYGDYIDRMQKKLDTLSQGQLSKINVLSGAVQNEQQQQSDYMADLLDLMKDRTQTNINATLGAFA